VSTIAEIEKTATAECVTLYELVGQIVDKIRTETPEPVLFDLGCGKNKFPGFQGVDFYADTDVKADLFNGDWSFTPDGSVDMFVSSHFLEHVPDLNGFMEKAYRKLKVGGYFFATTPYGHSIRAWQDPTHIRPIFRETYWYFNKAWRDAVSVDHYQSQTDFDVIEFWPAWSRKYAAKVAANPALAEDLIDHFNAVDDLSALLRRR
jgi:SAM-dependent methyltransferase